MFGVACLAFALAPLTGALPVRNQGKWIYGNGLTYSDSVSSTIDSPYDHYFDQRLDHFDRSNGDIFQQRYFVNTTYWKGPDSNAPVFLCVGGEGPPLDWQVLVSSVHCNDMVELAPKHGALLLALEHRYYGPSTPGNDLSTENLKWLNSEQALGDMAYFHSYISEEYELTTSNKWVTWGGSYPGMMAALARLRYPHQIHASVSSSSPLQAAVNMEEYNEVVADSMASKDVGGSQECLTIITEGHKTIGEMLKTTEGRSDLESLFNVCVPGSLEDPRNQEMFAGDGVVYLPVQSNDPACSTPLCNIDSVCTFLTSEAEGDALHRLADMSKAQSGGACKPVSYDLMIQAMTNPKNPERSWLYQTCTEWGFYQTCPEGSRCPYTQGLHTLESDYDICQTAFDINSTVVNRQIQYTNSVYGGDKLQATRILYPNGEIDPWHALGVLSSPNAQEPVLWVKAASHHFWTHPTLPTDDVYIREARVAIWDQVDAWLKE